MAGKADYSISAANFEWHSLVRDVLRNAFLLLLAFLIGVMGAYVATRGMFKAEYTSSAMLAVNVKNDKGVLLGDLSLSQQMADALQEVLSSEVLKKQVAQSLGRANFDGAVATQLVSGRRPMIWFRRCWKVILRSRNTFFPTPKCKWSVRPVWRAMPHRKAISSPRSWPAACSWQC